MTRSTFDGGGNRAISARARRVWDRLIGWYGTRVADTYGEDPPRDWCRMIDRVNDNDVKRALSIVRTKHPSHPPTLPEFESALRPPAPQYRDPHEPSPQELLVRHVMKHCRLTARQVIARWTFLYERVQWTGKQGEPRDELAKCVGVWIPSDGEVPGFKVPMDEVSTA